MTKEELRRQYPPLPDGGEAARKVVALWESGGLPESVFCYAAGKNECLTAPILCFCLRRGIPLAIPSCQAGGKMTARRITSFAGLRQGRYGILEPSGAAGEMAEPAVVIVPGLAFDLEGTRLGRGGGYYDRWLKGRTVRAIGLCRPERLVGRLPRGEWDVPVNTVITGG